MTIRPSANKVSGMTVDELKSFIHGVITEEMDASGGRHLRLWLTKD
jgi:hypothetical protein